MGSSSNHNPLLAVGVLAGFVLLVAAVWASGLSTAASLAITGILVLVGVGVLAAALERPAPAEDPTEAQRERMSRTTP